MSYGLPVLAGRRFSVRMPAMRCSACVLRSLQAAVLTAALLATAPSTAQPSPMHRAHKLVDQAKATVATAADKVWSGTQDLAVYALGLIGVSYRFGGESPDTGLDCSGLVRHVFQQVTGVTLPRTSKELARIGDAVAKKDLEPGDLVFFNTRRYDFSHVGIYLGDNRFIHAPRSGREVEIAALDASYWRKSFNGARRLVGVLPSMMPVLIATAEAATPAEVERAQGDDESQAIADRP